MPRRNKKSDAYETPEQRLTHMREMAIRLIALRELTGFSQVAWSRNIGIPVTTVNMWEVAKSRPDIPAARLVAKRAGTTLDYLIEGVYTGLPTARAAELQQKVREVTRRFEEAERTRGGTETKPPKKSK